ncbi:MAG: helix-turn-helix domain-containing protein [Iamia sp.]
MSSPSLALGPAVRARRVSLGLQQVELVELAGCSERFLSALEGGKTTVQLDKVLDVLGVLGIDLALVPGTGEITVDGALVGPTPGRRVVRRRA